MAPDVLLHTAHPHEERSSKRFAQERRERRKKEGGAKGLLLHLGKGGGDSHLAVHPGKLSKEHE